MKNAMFISELFIIDFLLIFIKITIIRTEWVELPQFSDNSKVYRIPTIMKSNNFNKFGDRKIFSPIFSYHLENVNESNLATKITSTFVPQVTTYSSMQEISVINNSNVLDEIKENIDVEVEEKKNSEESDENEDIDIDVEEEIDENTPQIQASENKHEIFHATDSTIVKQEEIASSTLCCETKSQKHLNQSHDKNDNNFLNYMPIDLLKHVHNTLKSQPTTLKGKIRFLKAFEKALLSDIESRLALAISPSRKIRHANDYHDHEDSIGFPSLEGALMTISFLTFAVYLVRLVMQLFRNINNNNNNTTATLIFGRRKRSIDEFTENAAKILSYIEKFEYYKNKRN